MRLTLVVLVAVLAAAPAKPPVPSDFAYGMTLDAKGESAFYQVPLPPQVYQGMTRADQGDLLVFNSLGEVVPFALRQPVPLRAAPVTVALPMFPLWGTPPHDLDGLSFTVRRDNAGAIVSVNTHDRAGPERRVMAYLVDASALERALKAVALEWERSDSQFVARITVEASDELERWDILVKEAIVASLRYGEHSLKRSEVPLPVTQAKYLRLSINDEELVSITGVKGTLADEVAEPPRQWVSISATTQENEPHDYYFDSQGHRPVDRVRVKLPQKNTLVKAALASRDREGSPWQPRGQALIYDLRIAGVDLMHPDITVQPTSERYWRLHVESVGGGLGQGSPVLELGWSPQQLVFVARGSGPFLLAYGSTRIDARAYRADSLLSQFEEQRQGGTLVKAIQPGPPRVLGGKAMLEPPAPPLPWKQWVLWLSLVIGVVLLAWMATRLYKQLSTEGNERNWPGSGG
jgi:hypothetical protein